MWKVLQQIFINSWCNYWCIVQMYMMIPGNDYHLSLKKNKNNILLTKNERKKTSILYTDLYLGSMQTQGKHELGAGRYYSTNIQIFYT